MSQRVLFAGAVLTRPGAATKIDASGFANFALSGVGVVGLVGEADGGAPQVLKAFRNGQQAKTYYRSGPLVEAAQIAFNPSADERITNGASLVVCVKVNGSTQAVQHLASVAGGISDATGVGVTNQGVAGSTAYTYQVVAQYGNAAGIAGISTTKAVAASTATGNATLNSSNFNRVAWSPVTGAIAYLVYRSAGGATQGLIGSVVFGTNQFDDTGLVGDGTTAPTVNSTKDALLLKALDYGKHTNFISAQVSAGTTASGRILTLQFIDGGVVAAREVSPSLGDTGKFTLLWSGAGTASAGSVTGGQGPFIIRAAQHLDVKIDGGASQVWTFSGTRGAFTGSGATYAAVGGTPTLTLRLNEDTSTDQVITFAGTENTQALYLAAINDQWAGGSAVNSGGQIKLQSDRYGTSSNVRVVAGTAGLLTALGTAAGLGVVGTATCTKTGGTGTKSVTIGFLDAATVNEVVTAVQTADNVTGGAISNVGGFITLVTSTVGAGGNVQVVNTSTIALNVGGTTALGFDFTVHAGAAGVTAATVTVTPTGLTTTITGSTADNLNIVWSNFQSLADVLAFINSTGKYTATALVSNANRFNPRYLDNVTAASILSVANTLYATRYDVMNWINTNSQLVSATIGTGDNQPAVAGVAYASGGYRGVSKNSDFTSALNLLGTLRVNQVVPCVSSDGVQSEVQGSVTVTDSYTMASVVAAADAHSVSFSSVKGKSERETWIGWALSKNNLIAQATNLQSFHTVLTGQKITLPTAADNSLSAATAAGTMTAFPEWALAVTLAGMRAGAPLGEPLTWKYIRQYGITQDSSWSSDPGSTDPDDLNLAGVTVCETVPGAGVRVVKCVTTYSRENNDAYVEESVVQGWKYIAYTWRTALENRYIGTRGIFSNVNTVIPYSKVVLGDLRDQGQIADSYIGATRIDGFRDFTLDLSGDTLSIGATVSPVEGINFILQTMYIVPARITQ